MLGASLFADTNRRPTITRDARNNDALRVHLVIVKVEVDGSGLNDGGLKTDDARVGEKVVNLTRNTGHLVDEDGWRAERKDRITQARGTAREFRHERRGDPAGNGCSEINVSVVVDIGSTRVVGLENVACPVDGCSHAAVARIWDAGNLVERSVANYDSLGGKVGEVLSVGVGIGATKSLDTSNISWTVDWPDSAPDEVEEKLVLAKAAKRMGRLDPYVPNDSEPCGANGSEGI